MLVLCTDLLEPLHRYAASSFRYNAHALELIRQFPFVPTHSTSNEPPAVAADPSTLASTPALPPSLPGTSDHDKPPLPNSDNHQDGADKDLAKRAASRDQSSETLVAASDAALMLAPPGFSKGLLDSRFVRVQAGLQGEAAFLSALGVVEIKMSQFVVGVVVPAVIAGNLPSLVRNATMAKVLLSGISSTDAAVAKVLSETPFVPTLIAGLRAPQQLYDPMVTEITALLDPGECYPAAPFDQSAELVQSLRLLGLRTSVDLDGLAAVAITIAEAAGNDAVESGAENAAEGSAAPSAVDQPRTASNHRNVPSSFDRAVSLLTYIDDHAKQLFGLSGKKKSVFSRMFSKKKAEADATTPEQFFARLAAIRWLPVLTKRPQPHLPWLDDGDEELQYQVACPSECRAGADMWLCSSSLRIIAVQIRSPYVLDQLGFTQPIHPRAVSRQLLGWQALVEAGNRNAANDGEVSAAAAATQAGIRAAVSTRVPELYGHLFTVLKQTPALFSEHIATVLHNAPWVWTGGNFLPVERVARRARLDCRPYLHTLSSSYNSEISELFLKLGVRDRFGAAEYAYVLEEMYTAHSPPPTMDGSAAFSAAPSALVADAAIEEDSRELKAAADADADDGDEDAAPLPSHELPQGQLRLALAVAAELFGASRSSTVDGVFIPDEHDCLSRADTLVYNDSVWQPPTQFRLVHSNISNTVAAGLGIRSLIQFVVGPTTDGDLQPYGQEESLTSRLSGLLEVYPDGPSIFKELVQNADDAGATTVKIMIDMKQWGTTSVLGEDMAGWQGPAVYVYNDAVFREKDFASLASLANSNKLGDVASTGRFGCGWNSVYHFTDLPSIVSGDHVVFLDPHRAFLPGAACSSRPGIKMRFSNTKLDVQFPDQFAPFKKFGCNMKTRFEGTLFRFPLRTAALAAKSEIKSNSPYTYRDIRGLFDAFRAHLDDLLLFLKNTRSVVVSEALADGSEVELYSAAVRSVVDVHPPAGRERLYAFLRASSGGAGMSHAKFIERLQGTPTADLPLSVHRKEIVVKQAAAAAVEGGGSAVEELLSRAEWLVCMLIGGESALQTSYDASTLKLVPMAGVATRLPPASPVSGRAFVSLPLPVETMLPLHVNGCFEISSNRRDVWSGNDMTGDGLRRSSWNEALLKDTVAKAWLELVLVARDTSQLRSSPSHAPLPHS